MSWYLKSLNRLTKAVVLIKGVSREKGDHWKKYRLLCRLNQKCICSGTLFSATNVCERINDLYFFPVDKRCRRIDSSEQVSNVRERVDVWCVGGSPRRIISTFLFFGNFCSKWLKIYYFLYCKILIIYGAWLLKTGLFLDSKKKEVKQQRDASWTTWHSAWQWLQRGAWTWQRHTLHAGLTNTWATIESWW